MARQSDIGFGLSCWQKSIQMYFIQNKYDRMEAEYHTLIAMFLPLFVCTRICNNKTSYIRVIYV